MEFDPNQADWQLLPHDPRAFFRLERDFDLKALKRAYNAGIRIFKPDQFPAEFQKIRSAYEDLERQLRYAQGEDGGTAFGTTNMPWRLEPQLPESPSANDHAPALDHPLANDERLPEKQATDPSHPLEFDTASTDQRYERLIAWPRKEAWHYYHLAILSDFHRDWNHEAAKGRSFVDWILEGIRAFPKDAGLATIWNAYCRQDGLAIEELVHLVRRVFQQVSHPRFFALTEVLWDQIVVRAEWSQTIGLLEELESRLVGVGIESRIQFYLHFLQRALWKAPIDWTLAKIQWVNSEGMSMHHQSEYELELVGWLAKYLQKREMLVSKGDIFAKMDECLRNMFLLERRYAIEGLFRLQVYMANHQREVLSQIRGDYASLEPLLLPWYWISESVLQSYEEASVDPESVATATFQLFRFIENHFPQSDLQSFGTRCQLINLGVWILCVFPFLAIDFFVTAQLADPKNVDLAKSSLPAMLWLMIIPITIGGVIWTRKQVHQRWIIGWHNRACRVMIEKNYRRWWRRCIARFFNATHYRFHHVDAMAAQLLESRGQQLNVTTWFRHFFPIDGGLLVYSLSVRFLR